MKKRINVTRLKHGDPIPAAPPRRYVQQNGYVVLRWTVGYYKVLDALEHRVVMGLPPDDLHVHHKNGQRDDNRPENLAVLTPRQHAAEHASFDIAAAADDYRNGMSYPAIAKKYGSETVTVMRTLKSNGVVSRPRCSKDQTHCVNGHPFNELNTRFASGQRQCRECIRIRGRKYYHQRNPGAGHKGPYRSKYQPITGTASALTIERL